MISLLGKTPADPCHADNTFPVLQSAGQLHVIDEKTNAISTSNTKIT
ncbi:MAG: hypothetical protein ACTSWN_03720 [Promethearchaeota archaeon]